MNVARLIREELHLAGAAQLIRNSRNGVGTDRTMDPLARRVAKLVAAFATYFEVALSFPV